MTFYYSREITRKVKEALEDMPVVVLTGLRQVGKSTLLERDSSFKKRRYVTFDDYAVLAAAQRDPEAFLGDGPLSIDEVQRDPEILSVIKRQVDLNRKPGRYLLSGSANLRLLKGVSESLAGRALYLELQPFTYRERLGRRGQDSVLAGLLKGVEPPVESPAWDIHEITRGGLPSVALGFVRRPETWFKGYVQTYLERDLRDLSHVGDLAEFRRLMQLLALRMAKILSVSELARDAKMNVMTVTRYLSLLETSYVIRRLPPYLGNQTSRLVKSPKLYFTDCGLGAHLAGGIATAGDSPMKGALLENWVVQNLIAESEAILPDAVSAYWNIQGRYEVDLVIESEGRVLAVEVKWGSRPTEWDLRGLGAFLKAQGDKAVGVLATTGRQTVKMGKNLWAVPIPILLS